jgi:hypothetical protein
VGLAQKRLAHQGDGHAGARCFDGGAQTCSTRSYNKDVMFMYFVICHLEGPYDWEPSLVLSDDAAGSWRQQPL